MAVGVSGWRLARTVSRLGQLGMVAGTALDQILVRTLQDGDPDGHVRRALEHFPFAQMARRIVAGHFRPEGRLANVPYQPIVMPVIDSHRANEELCIVGNFVAVFLAREGHDNPVGVNYLEKIQPPHLPSLYGAILAGAAVISMGAGIPIEIPAALEALAAHQPASYAVHVAGAASHAVYRMQFDPGAFRETSEPLAPLPRPAFLPIVSSATLATMLYRRLGDTITGFVAEGPLAGGHNAPPRGPGRFTDDGQPIYGPRDVLDIDGLRKLGLPFWLAGSYGSPEGLRAARALGAAGIQVGTAFALCEESGLLPEIRRAVVQQALNGTLQVLTNPIASPTGFPFKVANLKGSLGDQPVYNARARVCDLGFLREPYLRPDGRVGYRCNAEPVAAFIAKGGTAADTGGRMCLCNGLLASIGLVRPRADGSREPPLVTLGDDVVNLHRFCSLEHPDYTAADVLRVLTGVTPAGAASSGAGPAG